MKKTISILILICCLFVSGCYDYADLKNSSFCFGIALDYGEDKKYHLTIETGVLLYQSKESKFQTIINEAEGDTLNDAIAAISATTSSLIDYTHCQLVIFSKEVAKEDLKPLIENFFNNVRIPNNINILISNADSAKAILKTESITNVSLSFEIVYSIRDTANYYSRTFKKKLIDVYNDMNSEFEHFLIPSITIVILNNKEVASLEGAFVIEENKASTYLEDEEMLHVIIVQQLLPNYLKTIEYNGLFISFKVDKSERKILKNKQGAGLSFNFELTVVVMHHLDDVEDAIKELGKILEKEVSQMYEKYQKENIDIFRLKYYMYKYQYSEYLKYQEKEIKELQFNVDFKLKIKSEGIIK